MDGTTGSLSLQTTSRCVDVGRQRRTLSTVQFRVAGVPCQDARGICGSCSRASQPQLEASSIPPKWGDIGVVTQPKGVPSIRYTRIFCEILKSSGQSHSGPFPPPTRNPRKPSPEDSYLDRQPTPPRCLSPRRTARRSTSTSSVRVSDTESLPGPPETTASRARPPGTMAPRKQLPPPAQLADLVILWF